MFGWFDDGIGKLSVIDFLGGAICENAVADIANAKDKNSVFIV